MGPALKTLKLSPKLSKDLNTVLEGIAALDVYYTFPAKTSQNTGLLETKKRETLQQLIDILSSKDPKEVVQQLKAISCRSWEIG